MTAALALLLAEISLSNNGYLFAPTAAQIETAKAHPDVVTFAGGLVYRIGTRPAQFEGTQKTPRLLLCEGPDYEALILNRQAASGLYD